MIYNRSATKYNGYKKHINKQNKKLVVIGINDTDIELMKKADYAIAYKDSTSEVKQYADVILKTNSLKDALRYVKKIYHSRKINK